MIHTQRLTRLLLSFFGADYTLIRKFRYFKVNTVKNRLALPQLFWFLYSGCAVPDFFFHTFLLVSFITPLAHFTWAFILRNNQV